MFVPIHPSNVEIIKLKIDKDRKELLERKAEGKKLAHKSAMQALD